MCWLVRVNMKGAREALCSKVVHPTSSARGFPSTRLACRRDPTLLLPQGKCADKSRDSLPPPSMQLKNSSLDSSKPHFLHQQRIALSQTPHRFLVGFHTDRELGCSVLSPVSLPASLP